MLKQCEKINKSPSFFGPKIVKFGTKNLHPLKNTYLLKGKKKTEAAKEVGKLIATRLLEKGITRVIFDRGRFLYHGRVKALADAARESGLQF